VVREQAPTRSLSAPAAASDRGRSTRRPAIQVFQYALDDTGIVDDGNLPHRPPTLRTFEELDLIDLQEVDDLHWWQKRRLKGVGPRYLINITDLSLQK
jgi:hypothetical protein